MTNKFAKRNSPSVGPMDSSRLVVVSKPNATVWVASVELSPAEVESLTVDVRIPAANETSQATGYDAGSIAGKGAAA